jgi:hypothetical protein
VATETRTQRAGGRADALSGAAAPLAAGAVAVTSSTSAASAAALNP